MCILIFTVISFQFYLLIFASGLTNETILIFPKEVFLNESFNVSINTSLDLVSDVKIFVKEKEMNEKPSSILSLIFNKEKNKWTNSYFYLEGSFPIQKNYLIRVHSFKENVEICLKLRDFSTKKIILNRCQFLKVLNKTKNSSVDYELKNLEGSPKHINFNSKDIDFQTTENKIRKNIFIAFLLFLVLVFILLLKRKI